MRKVLTGEFFNQPAPKAAEYLLGKYLVRKINGAERSYLITETEAYEGEDDLASHASKGRTKRTDAMFGEPGIFYVYLVYGMHYMLNVVTREKDYPSAILIRAVENISGPGRLTKELDIGMNFNNMPALPKTGLWFEDRGGRGQAGKIPKKSIQKTARIGVTYAGPLWSNKLWRFLYNKDQK